MPAVDFGRDVSGRLAAAEAREWLCVNGIGTATRTRNASASATPPARKSPSTRDHRQDDSFVPRRWPVRWVTTRAMPLVAADRPPPLPSVAAAGPRPGDARSARVRLRGAMFGRGSSVPSWRGSCLCFLH